MLTENRKGLVLQQILFVQEDNFLINKVTVAWHFSFVQIIARKNEYYQSVLQDQPRPSQPGG
jgi:hypothetical protein